MSTVGYRRHRFSPEIIQHAVWLYFRFPLSYRNVEDLLAERGIGVSYETVRRWALKFGLLYARRLRRMLSLPEAQASVAVGHGVAVLTQLVVFPLFGLKATLADSMTIGAIFTLAALARSYALRRLTTEAEREQWLTAPTPLALELQRPLRDDALRIIGQQEAER